MTKRWFDIYAPLQMFDWDGDCFELSPGLCIKRFGQTPDLHGLNTKLSTEDQNELFYASHWLNFRWDEGTEPSPAENINLALLALWLVKSTKTQVAFRFKLGPNATTAESGWVRLLDRFQRIPDMTCDQFDDRDLRSASTYYEALRDLLCNRGRLSDALLLTLSGCCSHHWQVALVCYAAAAETLLTYSTDGGITKRLATAYACLVATQPNRRDAAFQDFRALYSIRSDIMHGRTGHVAATDRLPTLAKFADMVRTLWREVVSSVPLITALEGTDAERKAYFNKICDRYSPP